MKLYKLTDEKNRTRGGTQWGEGVTHEATGDPEQGLCSDGWIHAYEHPLLAVLLNPLHANFTKPNLWECEGEVGKRDGQLKVGCRNLTTLRQIPLPGITLEQRVRFAILCAKKVYTEPAFVRWADNWLGGSDRSAEAARAARAAARAAAEAARAARAAAEAARAAVWAAARAAARAAAEAEAAARAAAWAARAADVDLIAIAEEACR